MKRIVARLLAVGLLAGLLMAPSFAMANVLPPAPADGQKVALDVYSRIVYQYPAGSGAWYLDAWISNYPSYFYSSGTMVVDPRTTIEYVNDDDDVVGTETFATPVNVLSFAWQPTSFYPDGYYRTFHHRLALPAGASPTLTRLAVEVPPTDPAYPKYHFGIAASTAEFAQISRSIGPVDDTTLGGGRTQTTVTVTNNTAVTVGPVQVQGNERYYVDPASKSFLDNYDVTANEPAKALRLAPGESTTFTLRGLVPTPAGQTRDSSNMWCEAEPTDLYGTVSFGGAALEGVSVTLDGYSPHTTIFNGGYAIAGIVPGSHTMTFSKPGFMTYVGPVTTVLGSQISRDFAMSTLPSLTRSPAKSSKTYKRKHGKVSYTLSATVKGIGSVPVGGVKVYLQKSKNGRTHWKNYGAVKTSDAAGLVARSFTSKKRSTNYYRWVIPAQTDVLATPHTSKQKIVVK
jgi:hypothetical protein